MMDVNDRPYVIPLFLPGAGCPHQCSFCNQSSITGFTEMLPSPEDIVSEIERYLGYMKLKDRVKEISFYGGNFLGLSQENVLSYLNVAKSYIDRNVVNGIRFSTRPDTITPKTINLIRPFPVSTVELGVQSMSDRVLEKNMRGHTSRDTCEAVKALKGLSCQLGIQIMVGLPEDTDETLFETARSIILLRPQFVRIYPVLVIKDSLLEQWFLKGMYHPLTLEDAVEKVKKLYSMFRREGIRVIRMGLQATEDLNRMGAILGGPYHPSFGHIVMERLYLDCIRTILDAMEPPYRNSITIHVSPSAVSVMRGLRNRNVQLLKEEFQIPTIRILPDPDCGDQWMVVEKKWARNILACAQSPSTVL